MSSTPPRPAEIQPPWLSMLSADFATHAQRPESACVQVATVRGDGRPASRVLTFRRFGSGGELVFAADLRREPSPSPMPDAFASLAWYLPDAKVQWLLGGRIEVAGPGCPRHRALRQMIWDGLDEGGRERVGAAADEALRAAPPAHFGVLIASVDEAERHDRRARTRPLRRWRAGGEETIAA